jgi:glycosyltransferase involved in cell wall biosynthesis
MARGISANVVVYLRQIDSELEARLGKSGIRLLSLSSRSDLRRLRVLLSSPEALVHAATPIAGLVGLAIARLHRRPLVYSFTNCLHAQRPLRRMSGIDRLKAILERVLAASADAVHSVSKAVSEQIVRSNPAVKPRLFSIVHRFTEPVDGATTADLPVPRFANAYPRLLLVARLLPHKRVMDAVEAFATVRLQWPEAKLVVLGKGPLLASIRHAANALHLHDAVAIVGESSTLRTYMEQADLLVHPSLFEGFPRVIAEAEMLGLPVVSVDAPYSREAREKYDRVSLARPFDSSALAEAVLRALPTLKSPVLRDASDDTVETFERMYRSLLRTHNSTISGEPIAPKKGRCVED